MPSIPASVGARPGTDVTVEAQSRIAEAEADAREGDEQRVARGAGAAQHDQQQDHRDHEAGDLADGEAARRGAVEELAGVTRVVPAGSASPAAVSSRSRAAVPRSSGGTSYWTAAATVEPSGEVRVSTPATCGWRSSLLHQCSTAASARRRR